MAKAPSSNRPFKTASGIFAVRSISSGSTWRRRNASIFWQYSSPSCFSSADSSGGRSRSKLGFPMNTPAIKLKPVRRSRASSIRSIPLNNRDILLSPSREPCRVIGDVKICQTPSTTLGLPLLPQNPASLNYNPISWLTPQGISLPSGQYLRDGCFGSLQNRVTVVGAECLEIQV